MRKRVTLAKSGVSLPTIGGSDSLKGGQNENDRLLEIAKKKSFGGNDSAPVAPASEPKPNNDSAPEAVEPEAVEPVAETPEPTEDKVVLTQSDVAALKGAIDSLTSKVEQAEKAAADAKAEAERIKAEKDAADKQKSVLEELFSGFKGSQNPGDKKVNFNTKLEPGRDKFHGAANDWNNIVQSARAVKVFNPQTGQPHIQRDWSEARQFFRKERDNLRSDWERTLKAHGYLQGGPVALNGSDAATLASDIPDGFLTYASMMMRETHSARYIYWQFPYRELELGKGPGTTINVPRFSFLTEASAVADRTLTPGTATNSGNQNLAETSVAITLTENGLGKGSGSEPVAIPEFVSSYSLLNLENALNSRLTHDYNAWQDLSLRTLLLATTKVLYNDNGNPTATAGNVGTGDDGTMTEEFLYGLFAYLQGLQVPTYDNGMYVLVLHSTAAGQLKKSLAAKAQYLSLSNILDVTNIMNTATNGEVEKVNGYIGNMGNFMIFETNAHSLGAAGTEGAQNVTLGVGSTLTRTSLVFGQRPIAEAVGMPVEIRRDSNDDFGRLNRYIWLEHAGRGYLDVDSAIAAAQQTRCFAVRTCDVAV